MEGMGLSIKKNSKDVKRPAGGSRKGIGKFLTNDD